MNNTSSIGKAHLESTELRFRGSVPFRIPLQQVTAIEVQQGQLRVAWPEGKAVFDLGAAAEKWALKIRHPRSLLDKLGVKPGQRIAVLGIEDESFLADLATRIPDASIGRAAKNCDLIFCGLDSLDRCARAIGLVAHLKPGAALWTVFPKGRKDFGETQVRAILRGAGLIDTKVAAFSATHSSLKWTVAR